MKNVATQEEKGKRDSIHVTGNAVSIRYLQMWAASREEGGGSDKS